MSLLPPSPTPDKRCGHCDKELSDGPVGRRKKFCTKQCRQAAHRAAKRRDTKADKAADVRKELTETAEHLSRKAEDILNQLYNHPSLRSASPDDVIGGWEKKVNNLAIGAEAIAHRIAELANRHRQLYVEINERTQHTQPGRRNRPPNP